MRVVWRSDLHASPCSRCPTRVGDGVDAHTDRGRGEVREGRTEAGGGGMSVAGLGGARLGQGRVGRGKARGKARLGAVRLGVARRGLAGHG